MVKIITKYDYENRPSPGINFSPKTNPADRSLTNQADLETTDINKIMARYEATGLIIDAFGVERKPMWGDFTEVKNYHEMMIAIRNAERMFALLTADVRKRFENDPQKLIDFLENPENDEEAIKLGLKPNPANAKEMQEAQNRAKDAAFEAAVDAEIKKRGEADKAAAAAAAKARSGNQTE